VVGRLQLEHVALTGMDVPDAIVSFGTELSVVEGPSDTGKTFIVDCIDFMLGASSVREVPELKSYSHVLLALTLPDGNSVTLRRSVAGGNVDLYEGLWSSAPDEAPARSLRKSHAANNEDTLSGYLLAQVGLNGRAVRKNKYNKLVSLSFRDIAHLCVVDEIAMQAETPPELTGQYTTKTKELSVLRVLLEDSDDSNLTEISDKTDARKLTAARAEVIEAFISRVQGRLKDAPDAVDLRAQLGRLNAEADKLTDAVNGRYAARDKLGEERSKVARLTRAKGLRHDEIRETHARFEVLLAQYRSDLERLDLIEEAGKLWKFFDTGTCPYCGAAEEHQHPHWAVEEIGPEFRESLDAERSRTKGLAFDLRTTLLDLRQQDEIVVAEYSELQARGRELDILYRRAEREAVPASEELKRVLNRRAELQKVESLYGQLRELEEARKAIQDEDSGELVAAADQMNGIVVDEFSAELRTTLRNWGYPHADSVRYDRPAQDVWAHGQLRSSHGKGVRALLHAAFTVSLAQYCLARDIPHPGFVVLDSPLVTYRAPSTRNGREEIELVSERFYQDLATRFIGQAIVMENIDVPTELDNTRVTEFTGDAEIGRLGFLQPLKSGTY
jgi:hypothetical protein